MKKVFFLTAMVVFSAGCFNTFTVPSSKTPTDLRDSKYVILTPEQAAKMVGGDKIKKTETMKVDGIVYPKEILNDDGENYTSKLGENTK
ncbi:MAG: hypothetical protein WC341_16300 [Bacteroidales bacterium]|jgi:hypothetical protein